MEKMKQIGLMMALVLGITLPVFSQSADEIIQKHEAAMGGADKLNALKSLIIKGKLSIQGNDIISTNTYLIGQAFKSETEVMGNKIVQAYDGKSAWMIRPAMMGGTGKPEDAPAEILESMNSQLQPGSDLLIAKKDGSKIELESKEKVDGVDAYAFTITNKSGKVSNVYVSTTTYFILKVTSKQNVNGTEVESEQNYSNYKPVDGIYFPFTTQASSPMGGGVLNIEVIAVEVNPKIDPSVFKKPEN